MSNILNFIKNIYGSDVASATQIKKKLGINLNIFTNQKLINEPFKISTKLQNNYIIEQQKDKILGEEAKQIKIANIDFYAEKAHIYKGIRHKNHYPVRGQRTKTNRQTARKHNCITTSKQPK